MVKLFRLNIPAAVACILDLAVRVERSKCSADSWVNLAIEIESGKYLTLGQVNRLVEKYPFLREFRS